MKPIAFRILIVLSLATLLILGVDWVLERSGLVLGVDGLGYGEWPGLRSLESAFLAWIPGIAAVALPILAAAAWLLVGRDDSIVATSAAGDEIRLAPSAIERVVVREVRLHVAAVLRVGAVATQGPKRTPRVVVNVAASDRAPIPEVERAVRKHAVRALEQLLGIGSDEHVRVVVHDIKGPGAADGRKAPRRGQRQFAAARRAKALAAEPVEAVAERAD